MLPYGRQVIDEADVAAVVEALRAPLLTCGPLVARFEAALAAWIGAPHASVCSSGTAALHLAYAGLGIGEDDEIITSPITFSATAAAAYYVGAKVRVADVDRAGNLLPGSIEDLITTRTRAIVPVHLGGLPADMDEIAGIARRYRLRVIEDACHALGATYKGTAIGAGASDAVVFSFHPVKHITTGEGGAIVTRDPNLKRRIDRLRHHGIERDADRFEAEPPGPWAYEVQELGFNYRLSDFACALGLAQLAKLDGFLAARRAIAACYRQELARAFAGDPRIAPPLELADRDSAYHLFAVAIDFAGYGTTRARVVEQLADAGIASQVHYIPLLQHPLHAERCPSERARPRPGADRYYARTLSLPIYPSLAPADVARVVEQLHRALGAKS
ncbi:MAG TPA: UDP-4-amino-4,6-dideoxy-N-acetyl-beta-L-altrosamine transaminase [Kofleriaceae bacterium]|nr:UDP-4-amino-4,6-dideoxy-N-acetyl-beta-L-altrosamine transaminase [Kofleriaceae bacterium]